MKALALLVGVALAGCASSVSSGDLVPGDYCADCGDGPYHGGDPASGGDNPGSGGDNPGNTGGDTIVTVPDGLIDPARITTWKPGILEDTQLHLPLGDDGLPQRTSVCATLNPGDDIQQAIDSCPEGHVVQLNAGTFSISATLTITKGIVLRGAGSDASGTIISKVGGESVIDIGTAQDGTCYGGNAKALTSDAAKESTTLAVGSATSAFTAGNLALVDVVDDATVQEGDCAYFKRVDKRSASQRVEVAAVNNDGTLTISSPLHWNFPAKSPYLGQVTPVTDPTVRWAGVEHVYLQNGNNPGYDGQMAGGIDISNAAYSWVKDVQTDGTIGGMHIALTGTYRVVVRDSYVHHSANYGFGADCYGIVMRCGTAESLIENNIARYMNKPIMLNTTGGGNVIAYNYADNSWATPSAWQESNIDCHCSFPHMELIEGNYAPHMGASTTHGNAGYLTYFRNYASSQFAHPTVAGDDAVQTGDVCSLDFDGGDIGMNVVGNVLGTAGVSAVYDAYDPDSLTIYELGNNGSGAADVAATSLYRHGNFDYVHNSVQWDTANSEHTIPASLYLPGKPSWWPAAPPWPWTGPDLTPMVGELPAYQRAQGM